MQEMSTCVNEICWTFGVDAAQSCNTQNFIIQFLELEIDLDRTLVDVVAFCGYLGRKDE